MVYTMLSQVHDTVHINSVGIQLIKYTIWKWWAFEILDFWIWQSSLIWHYF